MMRLYFGFMVLLVLIDIFDRLFDRYGIRLQEFDSYPDKSIVFGRVLYGVQRCRQGNAMVAVPKESRFLIVRIPFFKSWGMTNPYNRPFPEFGFRSHKLFWFEGPEYSKGWHMWPPLEG